MSDTRPARFKGVIIKTLAPWLQRRFDRATLSRAIDATTDLGVGLDLDKPGLGALAATWYDARVYQRMFDVLLADVPEAEHGALAEQAAEAVLAETIRGIYSGLFAIMATPSLYARYAQKMWDTHYDTGRVTVVDLETGADHAAFDWAGHHPFACAVNRRSGASLYRRMGLARVRIASERCAWPVCESSYRWG